MNIKCQHCGNQLPEDYAFCPRCGESVSTDRGTTSPKPGDVVNNSYRLTRFLDQGAMGTVYEAEHLRLKRRVAVKFLHPNLIGTERFEKRFYAEALAASHLVHPNIVTVHDFGSHRNLLYLAMEYLDGRTLRKALAQDFPLPSARIVRILSQVAHALEVAHSQGVIHRDLKPENVILVRLSKTPDFVKVVDFGIAKLTHPIAEGVTPYQTAPGIFIGTPEYAAPEQAGSGAPDGRADVYSLGVILYEMLVGKVPFTGATPIEVLRAARRKKLVEPSKRNKGIGRHLEHVVLKSMEKDPENRFQSAEEFRLALLDAFRHEGQTVAPRADVGSSPASSRHSVTPDWFQSPIMDEADETGQANDLDTSSSPADLSAPIRSNTPMADASSDLRRDLDKAERGRDSTSHDDAFLSRPLSPPSSAEDEEYDENRPRPGQALPTATRTNYGSDGGVSLVAVSSPRSGLRAPMSQAPDPMPPRNAPSRGTPTPRPPQQRKRTEKGSSSPTLLLVEADPRLALEVNEALAEMELNVVQVGSGEEAVKRFLKSPPDLVIVRKELPGSGGFEVVSALRASASARKKVPIIIYSSAASPRELLSHRRSPSKADAYFVVPFPAVSFSHTVQNLLSSAED